MDSPDGELESSSGRSALLAGLGGFLVHRFSSGHVDVFVQVVNEIESALIYLLLGRPKQML